MRTESVGTLEFIGLDYVVVILYKKLDTSLDFTYVSLTFTVLTIVFPQKRVLFEQKFLITYLWYGLSSNLLLLPRVFYPKNMCNSLPSGVRTWNLKGYSSCYEEQAKPLHIALNRRCSVQRVDSAVSF